MTRQQTVQLALNEGWSVCCVVRIGGEVGGSRGRQQSSQLKYPHVGIRTVLPYVPSPSLRRKISSKSMIVCHLNKVLTHYRQSRIKACYL